MSNFDTPPMGESNYPWEQSAGGTEVPDDYNSLGEQQPDIADGPFLYSDTLEASGQPASDIDGGTPPRELPPAIQEALNRFTRTAIQRHAAANTEPLDPEAAAPEGIDWGGIVGDVDAGDAVISQITGDAGKTSRPAEPAASAPSESAPLAAESDAPAAPSEAAQAPDTGEQAPDTDAGEFKWSAPKDQRAQASGEDAESARRAAVSKAFLLGKLGRGMVANAADILAAFRGRGDGTVTVRGSSNVITGDGAVANFTVGHGPDGRPITTHMEVTGADGRPAEFADPPADGVVYDSDTPAGSARVFRAVNRRLEFRRGPRPEQQDPQDEDQ